MLMESEQSIAREDKDGWVRVATVTAFVTVGSSFHVE